jgi:hypothetical protein
MSTSFNSKMLNKSKSEFAKILRSLKDEKKNKLILSTAHFKGQFHEKTIHKLNLFLLD